MAAPVNLYIFVEGDDDERFFRAVIAPLLGTRYAQVFVHQRAREKDEKIEAFLRSIRSMGADYLFVSDLHYGPCKTDNLAYWMGRIRGLVPDRIALVIQEIEGWYFAGAPDAWCRRMKVPLPRNTDAMTKETFYRSLRSDYRSRVALTQSILDGYDLHQARQRNRSLEYVLARRLAV